MNCKRCGADTGVKLCDEHQNEAACWQTQRWQIAALTEANRALWVRLQATNSRVTALEELLSARRSTDIPDDVDGANYVQGLNRTLDGGRAEWNTGGR